MLPDAQPHEPLGEAQLPRRLGHVAAGGLQRVQNYLALHLVQVFLQRATVGSAGGFGGLERGGQVMTVDYRVVAEVFRGRTTRYCGDAHYSIPRVEAIAGWTAAYSAEKRYSGVTG